MKIKNKRILVHKNDLPDDLSLDYTIAIDTEAMGLQPHRDRLCLVQITDGSDCIHLIQMTEFAPKSPNLCKVLFDDNYKKIFHFARFDIAILHRNFASCFLKNNYFIEKNNKINSKNDRINNVFCTKIAARLALTFCRSHSLRDLCYDLLGVKISKEQQTSDWGKNSLSDKQLEYAAYDVFYLHHLAEKLSEILVREGRMEIAQAAFDFVPYLSDCDLLNLSGEYIFSH
ncbi:ribonuclease D [Lyticum sinuosum]|uniref:Ribonuclease D n=1 Tax=Lyticum sinuosum TaxID=1332059 RepID=A0AAE4VM38_9RICK|nr:ribonuclease D [Lyticum sinuosum]MDZ5761426.1 Ribonuclease D [Lyticum sinuosum]